MQNGKKPKTTLFSHENGASGVCFLLLGTFAIFTLAMLSACAHTHLKSLLPNYTASGAATLYIGRAASWAGSGNAYHVVLDGKVLGVIGPSEYWMLKLKPGKHTVGTYGGSLPVTLSPNSVTCITIELAFWTGRGIETHPSEVCPPPSDWKSAAQSGRGQSSLN